MKRGSIIPNLNPKLYINLPQAVKIARKKKRQPPTVLQNVNAQSRWLAKSCQGDTWRRIMEWQNLTELHELYEILATFIEILPRANNYLLGVPGASSFSMVL